MNARPDSRSRLSVTQLLPNVLTLTALCAGLTAMRLAVVGEFDQAVALILLAAVLDGLDGRLARRLRSESAMGAELVLWDSWLLRQKGAAAQHRKLRGSGGGGVVRSLVAALMVSRLPTPAFRPVSVRPDQARLLLLAAVALGAALLTYPWLTLVLLDLGYLLLLALGWIQLWRRPARKGK